MVGRDFLGDRIPLHRGRVVDGDGRVVGEVDAVELVTVGQRRGLGALGTDHRSYAVAVDVATATVVVGSADDLLTDSQELDAISFVGLPATGRVLAECSAHGEPRAASLDGTTLHWDEPQRLGGALVLLTDSQVLDDIPVRSESRPGSGPVLAQCSAHGEPRVSASLDGTTLRWDQPQRRVARGQSKQYVVPPWHPFVLLKSRYISHNPITTSSNTEPDVRFDLLYLLFEEY